MLAEILDVNFLLINDGISVSDEILQSNGVKQGGCMSPFLFIFAISDINDIMKDFPDVKCILYADDIVLLSKNLNDFTILLPKITDYLAIRCLKLNEKKCQVMKFRSGGHGRYSKVELNWEKQNKINFCSSINYLGVTFQTAGVCFSKHIDKRVKASIFATGKIKNLSKSSIVTAKKLFDLAISPVASYGIEAVWKYLTLKDLNNLECAKSRFFKKTLCVDKRMKSRFIYELVETDYFVSDLKTKFSLSDTPVYIKFLDNMMHKKQNIHPNFYSTPAMTNKNWWLPYCKDRRIFTRYSFHGYHFLLCKDKRFHLEVSANCVCQFCDEVCIEMYHFFLN